MKTPPQSENPIADLIAVARDLRDKNGGCPWDIEQTHTSLAKHLLEEASELIEVIEDGLTPETDSAFKEELGDVLFQVVIHAQLAAEEGRFTFADVARGIADKLISRHPHVYGDVSADTPDQVLKNWEAIKARERQKKQERTPAVSPGIRGSNPLIEPSYLDGVPKTLPALQRAERLGEKASRTGFDWPKGEPGTQMLRAKISEELAELDEVSASDQARAKEELGDLLFAVAQYGRRLGIDSEGALRQACNKFDRRFRSMETEAAGKDLSLEEWDVLWNRAKAAERH